MLPVPWLLVLIPLLAAGAAGERARDGGDWPRFLGPTLNGRSAETGLWLRWSERAPAICWQRVVGEGYGMPSISDGRLFLFDRHGDRARLTCLDSATGKELWRSEYATDYDDYYDFGNGPRATPVVHGKQVYTFGAEGRLRCHQVSDGKLLWEVDTARRFGVVRNFFGVGSTPLIEGDLLIAVVGGSPPGSPDIHSGELKGNGSGVVAFDRLSGEMRYSISDELAGYSSPVAATIGDRRWVFVLARGGLLGFEPTTGKIDFHFPWRSKKLLSVNAATPVVVGNQVLISESYGPGSALLSVRPGGYDVAWSDGGKHEKSLLSHWATPVHHQGYVYGVSGSGTGDAELRALELATGKIAWAKGGLGRTTMLYVDGHLVLLGEYGRLRVIRADPEGFSQIAELKLEDNGEPLIRHPAWNAPVLAKGLLYVRGKDRLVCLDVNPVPSP